MKVNLWYNKDMQEWRWTLVDDHRPILKMESGGRADLRTAMNDIATTVEYMVSQDSGILE
jgi:hypothetical protein